MRVCLEPVNSTSVACDVRALVLYLRPVSMCACALRVRVREKIGSYLFSLAVSMCGDP